MSKVLHVQVSSVRIKKRLLGINFHAYNFSCSVACFQAHKVNSKCQQNVENKSEIIEDRQPDRINVFTTVDTVAPEKLQDLGESEKIKELLKNPHLRNFLQEINSAPNSWNAMKLAMMEPIFLEFADECMSIVEPTNEIQSN